MGHQEPYAAQQGEVKSLAPEEEQPQAPVHGGSHPAGKQLGRSRPGGPGGHKIQHEPAKCFCCEEGKWYAQLHETKYWQQVNRGDLSSLLSTGEATVGLLCPVLGSPVQERHTGEGSIKGHKYDEGTGACLL